MRKLSGLLSVVALVALASVAVAGDEEAWFDLENCAFCNNFNAEGVGAFIDPVPDLFHQVGPFAAQKGYKLLACKNLPNA